jgi:hypothetical protein
MPVAPAVAVDLNISIVIAVEDGFYAGADQIVLFPCLSAGQPRFWRHLAALGAATLGLIIRIVNDIGTISRPMWRSSRSSMPRSA